MKKLFFLLLAVFAFSFLPAQKISPVVNPAAAGFSPERLIRLDREMNGWVQKEWMPGCAALIIRNGHIAYYKAAGFNNPETKTVLQKDAIFRIASQTKAITSVAIMILVEEGKLLLDDPVSKFIPAFKNQQVLDKFNAADTTYTTIPTRSEITVRQLLTHTSGIGYAGIGSKESNAIYGKSKLTAGLHVLNDNLLDAMNRLAKLPLMHQPGERWTYGLNTDLLGCLVEVISGMTLEKFFQTRIFDPLGMKDTYFLVPAEKAGRLVNLYREDSTGHYIESTNWILADPRASANYPLVKTNFYSGGAGLSSTLYDYAVFLQMLLNGGVYNGKRILSRNSVRLMTSNQIGDIPFGNGANFGLGFSIVSDKSSGRTPAQTGTFSWGGAFATSYWVDPKEKMVMLIFRQLQNTTHGDVVEKFRNLTYQAIQD